MELRTVTQIEKRTNRGKANGHNTHTRGRGRGEEEEGGTETGLEPRILSKLGNIFIHINMKGRKSRRAREGKER